MWSAIDTDGEQFFFNTIGGQEGKRTGLGAHIANGQKSRLAVFNLPLFS